MSTLSHGSWPSPVAARDRVAGAGVPASPTSDAGAVHWLESRPETGARVILCRRGPDGVVTDLSPEWMSVRSRVHEYGGGAYAARDGVVLAVDFETQRLWRLDGEPVALTPRTPDAALRWSAMEVDVRRGVVYAVREDHTDPDVEPVNELVRLPLADGEAQVVVPGRRRSLPRPDADDAGDPSLPDFVADPALSPDGAHLAWVQWSHPGMPWDAGEVWLGRLTPEGDVAESWRVAGGALGASASEPVWLDSRRLAFLSDPDGVAVPHVVEAEPVSTPVAWAPATDEHGLPGWQLRTRTLAALPGGRVAAVRVVEGRERITVYDGTDATDGTDLPHTVTAVSGLAPHGDGLVAEVGHVTEGWTTVAVDPAHGSEVVARRGTVPDAAYVAEAEAVSWPGHAGDTAYGFLHRPTHPEVTAPEGELPPLLVMAHGGPTSATNTVPSARISYYTSRGIAVLDVNYGGSTGYGRAYRERLRDGWGVVDIEDVVRGAQHLADAGVVDGARMGVIGGSAGGYVVLASLAFHDVFSAGISYFGVADPSLLAQETHKMESRYLDGLIGPWPAARATYDARSPLHHVDGIEAPLLLLQGLEDRVVPPSQTTAIADALRARGREVEVVELEGEGHGFRKPENIVRTAELELEFLGRCWGFTPQP